MKFKKHKKEEINFCQSGKHKRPYRFNEGETCFLVETSTMEKYTVRVIVCMDCKKTLGSKPIEKILLEA
ncbi:hypothetical protein IT409_00905 [Candidatus Falkowbacteria bacterium]|nr:hypothetical protein [Candidatus Falkowbacteria bacterium]